MGKTYHYQPAGDVTVTTTGNIDNLDILGCALLLMNNATLATIRGIKAGYPGQRLTIASIGAGAVNVNHNDGASAAANRILNLSGANIGLATGVGAVVYDYDSLTARWRQAGIHALGTLIDIPYSGGNFSASAGTWTVDAGDQISFAYAYVATNIVEVYFQFDATALTVASAQILSAALPFTPSRNCRAVGWKYDGTYGSTLVRVQSGVAALQLLEMDAANWPIAANISLAGQIQFPI